MLEQRANVVVRGAKLYIVNSSIGSVYTVMLTLKIRNIKWWRTKIGLPAIHRDQTSHSAVLEFLGEKR